MADSEDQAYFGIDILLEKIGGEYEQIKAQRRLLFVRLKDEGSKLNPGQKLKLRRLWRKMNKAYKRLGRHVNHEKGFTKRKMEQINRPWSLYHNALIEIYAEIFKGEDIRDGDADDTIHGMDWEKENGDNKEDDEEDNYTEGPYTVARLLSFYNYRRRRCQKFKLFIEEQEAHGFKERQGLPLELVQRLHAANQEAEKFENIYANRKDEELKKVEFMDYSENNRIYLRLLRDSYNRAEHFAANKRNANASHEHTGKKQMKTSLTGLLNQLKTENTRAR
jgi:hypothetical protein